MDAFGEEEEHMIDQLFFSCDINKTGLVEVNSVVDFLKKECNKSKSNEPDLVELANILIFHSRDGFVDIISYRKALKQWISAIRNRSESTSFLESVSEPVYLNMANNSTDLSICLETSAAQEDSVFRQSQDNTELINDMKFQNKKLCEENGKLQAQLETQEETVASLSKELETKKREEEQTKKKVQSLQDQVYMGQMVMEENEVLKNKLDQLQETRRELDVKVNSLEKENAMLDQQAWNFENKWQKSRGELDLLKADMKELQCSYFEQKVILNQTEEVKCVTEEENTKEKRLLEQIDALLKQNEKLQKEKEEAETKLTEAKVTRFGNVSEEENQPSPTENVKCSTPSPQLSICMELKDRLDKDIHLPSPLCERREISRELLFHHQSVLLPSYMSAWDLELSEGSALLDYSLEKLRIESPIKPTELDIEKRLASVKKLGKNGMETEIIKLYRVNLDLAEKCHKAELRGTDLLEEVKKNSQTAEEEKQKNLQLEESLHHSFLARNEDLKDFWRLVHNPEEDESSESDNSLSASTEILKIQIKQDIENLREKLQKRESVLHSLKKTFSRPPLRSKGRSSSSVLLDALNIDQESDSGSFDCHMGLSVQTECKDCYKNQIGHLQHGLNHKNNIRSVPLVRRHNKINNSMPHWNLKHNFIDSMNIIESDILQNNNVVSVKNKLNTTYNYLNHHGDGLELLNGENLADTNRPVHSNKSVKLDNTADGDDRDKEPALRRRSYVRAIENQACSIDDVNVPRLRTNSFQTAIEHGQSSTSIPSNSSIGDTTPENENSGPFPWNSGPKFASTPLPVSGKPVVKSVNFYPKILVKEESVSDEISDISSSAVNNLQSDCSEMYNSNTNHCDNGTQVDQNEDKMKKSYNNHRSSCKELSVLREEDLPCVCCGEDSDLNALTSSSSDRYANSPVLEDFSPEVWTLSRTSDNSNLSSSQDSGHSSSITTSCSNGGSTEQPVNEDEVALSRPYLPPKNIQDVQQQHKDEITSSRVIPVVSKPLRSNKEMDIQTQSVIQNAESVVDFIENSIKPDSASRTHSAPPLNSCNNSLMNHMDASDLEHSPVLLSKHESVAQSSNFLRTPDSGENVLLPLMAISPFPSPPHSPCINFLQAKESMKGPKDGEVSGPSSHEEQNNNAETSTQLTECDSSEMNNEPRTASHLSKIRETHLAKRRDQLRPSKMPELSELAEKDGRDDGNKQDTALDDVKKSDVIPHPEPNGEVLPCIPDEFLKNLGLSTDDIISDELSEQEIESKFASLSLAFKTDAQTLEKRLEIQERSRDIAEQNVDKELQGLRTALSKLNQICTDPQVREVLSKIQNHIDILEKASARVSSRAEVFGAIQQEKRLSKAVDIMVHHVENIHRVHEKEHAELEEARKLLQDSRSLGPSSLDIAGGDMLSRRSASVCPNNIAIGKTFGLGTLGSSLTPAAVKAIKLMKPRRRVSEIALPKVLGGSGAPSLHSSPSMDQAFEPRFPRAFVPLRSEFEIDEDEGNNLQTVPSDGSDSLSRSYDKDPRSRFQAVVASTTVKSAIANTLRRTSLEKHNNVTTLPSHNESPQISRKNSAESTKDVQDKEKQKNLEEEAFKKGYEQGMRASLGQDLSCLREQQNQINESLGDIMDNIDNHMEEPKGLRDILQERFQDSFPKVQISSWRIRLTMSCFLVVMAFLSILVSLFPVSTAQVFSYKPLGTPPM